MSLKCVCFLFTLTFISSLLIYSTLLGYLLFESAVNNNIYVYSLQVFQSLCVCIILLIASWIASNRIYAQLSRTAVLISNRAILITGCDTGFGHQLAIKCDKLGYHVFAGVLNPELKGTNELKSVCSNRIKVVKMDVTKASEVYDMINLIKQYNLQLWAVVNNAGISLSTPIEWGFDVKELEKTFSVNVFGTARVTKACLPLLRKSKGRVINVSCLASRFTFPGITYYSMSKHALRSLSDGMRRELSEFGINVITVEPYYYRTPLVDSNSNQQLVDTVWNETPKDIQIFYGGDSGRNMFIKQKKFLYATARVQTDEVIRAMVDAITLIEPKVYYRCSGFVNSIWLWIFCLLPETIQDMLLHLFARFITYTSSETTKTTTAAALTTTTTHIKIDR